MQRHFGKLAMISLAALGTALSGCTTESSSVGRLAVGLVTTGSDGALYRLPPDTSLFLYDGPFWDDYSLDGEQTSVVIDVPARTYNAMLVNYSGGFTTEWPLERQDTGGAITTVMATLITPMPTSVMVTENNTVGLTFSFLIPSGGTITFTHGSIVVDIDVDQAAPTSFETGMNASLEVIDVFAPGPPELASRLPVSGTQDLHISISARLISDWHQLNSTWACAQLEVFEATSHNHSGFADFLAESLGGDDPGAWSPASLCVYHEDGANYVRIRISRRGEATTPSFMDLGDDDYLFRHFLYAQAPDQAFDGQTLDLDVLLGTQTLPLTALSVMYAPDDDVDELWFYIWQAGTVAFSFHGLF